VIKGIYKRLTRMIKAEEEEGQQKERNKGR